MSIKNPFSIIKIKPKTDRKTVAKKTPVIISKMPVILGKFPKCDFNLKRPTPKKIIIIPNVTALDIIINSTKLFSKFIDTISEISKMICIIIIKKAISSTK